MLLFTVLASPVAGQDDRPFDLIPRFGATVGPEQFTFGVEAPIADVADVTYLTFAPSLDLGWGDNQTTVRANANLAYSFPTGGGDGRAFPIVGVGLQYQSFDSVVQDGEVIESSNTGLGVNVGAGAQVGDLVLEALIGLGDLPGLAVLVGYNIVL